MSSPIGLMELLRRIGLQPPPYIRDHIVTGISDHSNRIEPGYVFVATRGVQTDSHLFISDAISRGAQTVIVEKETPPYDTAQILRVTDSRDVLGCLVHAWYDYPAHGIPVVGITGTNGKTTTAFMVEAIIERWRSSCGVIGTIEHRLGDWRESAANTTPTATKLASLIDGMVKRGGTALAMEVSSHALDQRRVSGICFDVGVLINITQDHLDYHGTMEAYAEAKALLFRDHLLRYAGERHFPCHAIILQDDQWCRAIADSLPEQLALLRLSTKDAPGSHVLAQNPVQVGSRIQFRAVSKGMGDFPAFDEIIELPIPGLYNAGNALCALAAACSLGCPVATAVEALRFMKPVPGRLQPIRAGQNFEVLVDYAHTPDALENSLKNARAICRPGGKLIVVFGCGGDRDRTKRPLMGKLAIQLADTVIITDDNPRSEQSESILAMIVEGVLPYDPQATHHAAIPDRATAIRSAIGMATPGDVVLIAGKGHETYQEIHGRRTHFDDVEEASLALGGNPWCKSPIP